MTSVNHLDDNDYNGFVQEDAVSDVLTPYDQMFLNKA